VSWSDRLDELRPYFEAAGEKYGVPWQVIAGISAQESMFNAKPVGDGGNSMGMGHFNRRGAAAQYGITPETYRQLPESEQVDYIGRHLSDLRKQYGDAQWDSGGPKWIKAYNSAKAGIGDDNYLKNVQSRINDLGLGYDLFGGKSTAPATGLKPYDLQPPMSPNAPPADGPTPADLADYWESQKLAGTVKQGRAMANGGTVTERTAARWEEQLKFDASKFNPQFRDNLATLQSNLTDYTLAPSHPSAGFRDRATYKGNGAKGSAHFDGNALDITYPYGKVGELAELARNSGISEMAVYAPAGTAADQNVTVHLGGRDTGGKFLARQGIGSSKWVEPPKDHALYAYNGLPVVNGPAAPSITNNDPNAPRFAQFAAPEQPKSAPARGPSTMPSSPRGLGPMVADNYQPTSPISKALGMDLDQGFLARGLDKMFGGSGKSQRTPVSTRGFNDQAGPIPASQRPTQRATPTNSHGYRSPSAAGFAGGMLAQALSSLGDDGGSRVPDMPMDTTDYQSSFAESNDRISNNLSTLTQERWRRMIEEMS
jgi:hypothetical protein